MIEPKLVVFGSRSLYDFYILYKHLNNYICEFIDEHDDLTFVSGTARGADRLGEIYANLLGYKVEQYPADWDNLGKRAGFVRNTEMADISKYGAGFWDGSSAGTKSMIDLLNRRQTPLMLHQYNDDDQVQPHPEVVHCKRSGYDLYCGRPSKYANPYSIGKDGDRVEVLAKFTYDLITGRLGLTCEDIHALYSLRLGCWCRGTNKGSHHLPDHAKDLCHCDIYKAAQTWPEFNKPVIFFRGEYKSFSNFSRDRVYYKNKWWMTSEHAFQAAKTLDPNEQEWVRSAPTPEESKFRGRRVTLRNDWDDNYDEKAMRQIIRAKFQNHKLRRLLIGTGTAQIEEGNHHHDNKWGNCYCDDCVNRPGEDKLGRILMEERDRIRKQLKKYRDLFTYPHHSSRLYTSTGVEVATGYLRLVVGARGPYLEIPYNRMVLDNCHRENGHDYYFHTWRSNDSENLMIYQQLKLVSYADYQVGHFYIDPYKLYTKDGVGLMGQTNYMRGTDMPVCIFDTDDDGRFAAQVVRMYYNKRCYCRAGSHVKDFDWNGIRRGEVVILVDMGYPASVLKKLQEDYNLIIIDHHRSTIEAIEEAGIKPGGIQTLGEEGTDAACVLAWKHFFPNKPVPQVLQLVSDYDSHGFDESAEEPPALCFKYFMDKESLWPGAKTDATFDQFFEDDKFVEECVEQGAAVHRFYTKEFARLCKQLHFITEIPSPDGNGNLTALCANYRYGSVFFDSITEQAHADCIIMFGWMSSAAQWRFSVYPLKAGVECDKIAQMLFENGGGKAGAAGGSADKIPFELGTVTEDEFDHDLTIDEELHAIVSVVDDSAQATIVQQVLNKRANMIAGALCFPTQFGPYRAVAANTPFLVTHALAHKLKLGDSLTIGFSYCNNGTWRHNITIHKPGLTTDQLINDITTQIAHDISCYVNVVDKSQVIVTCEKLLVTPGSSLGK